MTWVREAGRVKCGEHPPLLSPSGFVSRSRKSGSEKRDAQENLFPQDELGVTTMNEPQTRFTRRAEGYLELGLPLQAIESLERHPEWVIDNGRACYLLGEALRELRRYDEAVGPLERAVDLMPDDIHAHLALAWCYKRTRRLSAAIGTLQHALRGEPLEPILHYNLACYYSLANNRRRALHFLSSALELDVNYIDLVPGETDFDLLRDDPEFQMLTSVIV